MSRYDECTHHVIRMWYVKPEWLSTKNVYPRVHHLECSECGRTAAAPTTWQHNTRVLTLTT